MDDDQLIAELEHYGRTGCLREGNDLRWMARVAALRWQQCRGARDDALARAERAEAMLRHFVEWAGKATDPEDECGYINGDSDKYPTPAGLNSWDDLLEIAAEARAILSSRAPSPLDRLVSGFSEALYKKLVAAEKKYGYDNAWMRGGWAEDLRQHLIDHLHKGDPRDVAAYCAFAWWHGWSVAPEADRDEHHPRCQACGTKAEDARPTCQRCIEQTVEAARLRGIDEGRQTEREACAQVADAKAAQWAEKIKERGPDPDDDAGEFDWMYGGLKTAEVVASDIRKRREGE